MIRKTKNLIRDERGQTSFFDAIMFFVVMLIASTLIFIFSNQAFQTQEVMSREDMNRYTEETREAMLQSTLHEAWYYDAYGNKVVKPPGSANINDLLLEELALLDDGLSQENFEDGYEDQINKVMAKLVRSGYAYALEAHYTNKSSGSTYGIFISKVGSSEDIPSGDVTTSQWSSPMVTDGKSGYATIKLSIWRT